MSLGEIIEGTASKGSFYHYFKSKQEVAGAVLDLVQALIPLMTRTYFTGRDWAGGIREWLHRPVGAENDGTFGFSLVAVLGLQLGPNEPSFHHKAKWGLKVFERSIIAELELRGFTHEQASRRSATVSALLHGYVMRLALTQDASCLERLSASMKPLAGDPDVPWPGRGSVFDSPGPRRARPDDTVKKRRIPIDFSDERSNNKRPNGERLRGKAEARRQKIIEGLADVLWRRGYHATSLQDISRTLGIPKGSLHSCVGDKRKMAFEVLDYYARVQDELFNSIFAAGSWTQAVGLVASAMKASGLSGYALGCPLANMGYEFVNSDAPLAAKVTGLLLAAEVRFAEALESYGAQPGAARDTAETAVALVHGHLTRCYLFGSVTLADECREDLMALAGVM
jgi:AcrR family transcriptional regulator